MSVGWIIILALGVLAAGVLIWAASLWLVRSWEVLDDDQLSAKLADRADDPTTAWLRMLGWFSRGPRRLTYRRDERGRFRKVRRY